MATSTCAPLGLNAELVVEMILQEFEMEEQLDVLQKWPCDAPIWRLCESRDEPIDAEAVKIKAFSSKVEAKRRR